MDIIEGIKIARSYLNRDRQADDELDIIRLRNFAEGFVIVYQTKKFIETNDFNEALIGSTPFIVVKKTGEIFKCSTEASFNDLSLIKYFKAHHKSERH